MYPYIFIAALCMLALIPFNVTYADFVLLKAKQYLDVQSGKIIVPGNILIENGVIKAVNPLTVPDKVTIISRPSLTLLPGLMDAHVHVTCEMGKSLPLNLVQDDAGLVTLRGAKNAKTLLFSGFTTVRDLNQCYPGDSFITVALAKASERGWIDAPHIIPAGHALGATGSHMDFDMIANFKPGVISADYRSGLADGVDEIRKSVRYQIKHGAKVIKAAATAGVLTQEDSVGAQEYSNEELNAIVAEASLHGVPVAMHAHGAAGIIAAIKAGVRSIEHGSLLDAEGIRLMKERGTYLVPTTYVLSGGIHLDDFSPVQRAKAEYIMPLAKKNLANAIRAGVKIAFGTDSGVYPHGENAKEFSSLVSLGMSPMEAIRSATMNAADLMQIKNVGQIKVGYDADIIGVIDDPVVNIKTLETVELVMKDGKLIK